MRKIILSGIYFLAFLLPWQTRYIISRGTINNGAWRFGDISIFASDFLIIFLFFASLFVLFKNRTSLKKFIENKYSLIYFSIAGLLLFATISIFLATNQTLAWFKLIELCLGLMVFFIVLQNNFNKLKLFFWFIVGAVLQALLAIWQFLNQGMGGNKWFGMAPHFAKNLGTSVIEAIGPTTHIWERWLRAYGSFGHPNILGGYLAINIILLFYFLAQTKSKNKSLAYTLLIILSAGLFFSFSRTAWIALVVVIILTICLQKIKKNITPIILIIITTTILLIPYHYLATSRFTDLHRIEVKSIQERISFTKNSLQLISKHPILGVGLGNYGLAVFQELDQRQLSYWYQPVHNVFLLIWTEIGIGALFFYFLLLYLLYLSWQQRQTENNINLSLLTALIIFMLFDHWLWSLHFGQIFFWLLLGVIIKNIFQEKNITKKV